MQQYRIALMHPQLGFGGSEHVVLSIAEALQNDYRVSLLTTRRDREEPSLRALNRFCGTEVDEGKVPIIYIPLPAIFRNRFAAYRGSLFARGCRRITAEFDLMFMGYGLMDLGVQGIQFMHDPAFTPDLLRQLTPFPKDLRRFFYQNSPLRSGYLWSARKISGFSMEGIRKNLTIVNSLWTGEIVTKAFGMATTLVYPPVRSTFPQVPWSERQNGFVCMGRWTREKSMERVFAILAEVRKRGFDLHLHLAGSGGDRAYLQSLKDLAANSGAWVTVHDAMSSEEKSSLMATQRFAISGRPNEPFGIALAETVKAGCITFAPNGGGQAEILNHPDLLFRDDEDAVQKIVAVIGNPELQENLRAHLTQGVARFSVERFRNQIRGIVGEFREQRLKP
jgi:glycosyltransferase involved in cell wall biosynthesis